MVKAADTVTTGESGILVATDVFREHNALVYNKTLKLVPPPSLQESLALAPDSRVTVSRGTVSPPRGASPRHHLYVTTAAD